MLNESVVKKMGGNITCTHQMEVDLKEDTKHSKLIYTWNWPELQLVHRIIPTTVLLFNMGVKNYMFSFFTNMRPPLSLPLSLYICYICAFCDSSAHCQQNRMLQLLKLVIAKNLVSAMFGCMLYVSIMLCDIANVEVFVLLNVPRLCAWGTTTKILSCDFIQTFEFHALKDAFFGYLTRFLD